MKLLILLFILFFQLPLWAKSISCAVPTHIYKKVKRLFNEKIAYTKMQVIPKKYKDNKSCLSALLQKEVKFAVIRSDILWKLQKDSIKWHAYKEQYITISTLPYSAQLYLIHTNAYDDIDIENLKGKAVSIDKIGQANGYLLKSLLKLTDNTHSIHYKSMNYTDSLHALKINKLDAFFGFLPASFEDKNFNFQTIFSHKVTTYLRDQNLYRADYSGIHIPYTLISSQKASDEEIENMIYRLKERGIFVPQTDEHFGPINRYVLQHLAQIELALNATAETVDTSQHRQKVFSQACLTYHYGFLDLLRRKPAMKKKLRFIRSRYPKRYTNAKKFFYEAENILLKIDAKKKICDLHFIQQKKNRFQHIEKNIYTLTK